MELMVPLYAQDKRPLYEQIYQYIKDEIRGGRLTAGSRLPSTRVLADNLKVSRSTTQMAYEQLLSEGYIEAVPCRGYFVAGIEELVEVKGQETGSFVPEPAGSREQYRVDFSPRGIDLDSFPFNTCLLYTSDVYKRQAPTPYSTPSPAQCWPGCSLSTGAGSPQGPR